MRDQRILSVAEWIAEYPDRFAHCEPGDPLSLFTDEFVTSEWLSGSLEATLENWCRVYPELRAPFPNPPDPAAIDRHVRAAFALGVQTRPHRRVPSPPSA